MDILASAGVLAQEIRDSAEVQAYLAAKAKLEADKNLLARVADFQANHRKLSALTEQDRPGIEEERVISSQYAQLMLQPAARDYLEAERALLTLVGRVLEILSGSVEGIVEA